MTSKQTMTKDIAGSGDIVDTLSPVAPPDNLSQWPADKVALSAKLRSAISHRSRDEIRALVAQGADPSVPFQSRLGVFKTPAMAVIEQGAYDYLEWMYPQNGLGRSGQTPLALSGADPVSLWQAIAQKSAAKFVQGFIETATELMGHDAAGVNAGKWQMIEVFSQKFLSEDGEAPPEIALAEALIEDGAMPPTPQHAIDLLGADSFVGPSEMSPFVAHLFANGDASMILEKWMDAGLSPDALIRGLTLLHWSCAFNSVDVAQALIAAGARFDIASNDPEKQSWGAVNSNAGKEAPFKTAPDYAQWVGSHDIAQSIRAAQAKQSIDSVLVRARNSSEA